MIAGIDSMVLIYAGVVPSKKGTTVEKELRTKAKILLHMLRDESIVLPTIAVAELLVPVPPTQKGTLISSLLKRFVCPSFNIQAASIASELWAQYKKLPHDLEYKNRHVLRADVKIIATAKSAGATVFYSNDKNCRNVAKLIMDARELPEDDPHDMFLKGDIESGEEI